MPRVDSATLAASVDFKAFEGSTVADKVIAAYKAVLKAHPAINFRVRQSRVDLEAVFLQTAQKFEKDLKLLPGNKDAMARMQTQRPEFNLAPQPPRCEKNMCFCLLEGRGAEFEVMSAELSKVFDPQEKMNQRGKIDMAHLKAAARKIAVTLTELQPVPPMSADADR